MIESRGYQRREQSDGQDGSEDASRDLLDTRLVIIIPQPTEQRAHTLPSTLNTSGSHEYCMNTATVVSANLGVKGKAVHTRLRCFLDIFGF